MTANPQSSLVRSFLIGSLALIIAGLAVSPLACAQDPGALLRDGKEQLQRKDFKAAWDYDLMLRLWRQGGGVRIPGPPLADFQWHPGSISGTHYRQQFAEEWRAAVEDAGRFSPQAMIHWFVRHGIVACYGRMNRAKSRG